MWYDVSGLVRDWGTEAVLSTSYKPRWVKIEHAAGDDTPSVYEVELYNSDGELLFGSSGQYTSYGLDSSGIDVQLVQIYNNSSSSRDVGVLWKTP